MADWRVLRGWSEEALTHRLEQLAATHVNVVVAEEEMTTAGGWRHYSSESVIARGFDDARFTRARMALTNYQFSDPTIVRAHFDPAAPLLNRFMLLDIRVLGLHYLCPTLVTQVRDEPDVYGFRYDTLAGHIERGAEWFLLAQSAQGELRFRIDARWRPGQLPNWWSRLGFRLLSNHYQRTWHRRAHQRIFFLTHYGSTRRPPADTSGLTLRRGDVVFIRHKE